MDMKEKSPMTSTTPAAEPAEAPLHAPRIDVSDEAKIEQAQPLDPNREPKMRAENVAVSYGDKPALKGVSIKIYEDLVTAFIGPSGCGKSTFLRCLNRMNDTIPSARVTGKITLDNEDITSAAMDVVQLRARVGMVSFIRLRQRRKVDLPHPEGPMNAVTRSS